MFLKNKQEEKAKEDKFNNTDIYENEMKNSNDYSNFETNKEHVSITEEDIKEEIFDSISNHDIQGNDKEDKDKSGSLHLYTSSQTFGYDNSVTSYNLDLYDHVENVEKN